MVPAERLFDAVAKAVEITGSLKAADLAVGRHEGNSRGALIKAVTRARNSGRASAKVVWSVRRFVESHENHPEAPTCRTCGNAIRRSKLESGWDRCDWCTYGEFSKRLGLAE